MGDLPIQDLKERYQIVLRGKIPQNCNKFAFNIANKQTGDILLHFNPRIQQGVVVRNTCSGGRWGTEEKQLDCPFPFAKGKFFVVRIEVTKNGFDIFSKGNRLCTFNHRMNVNNGNILQLGSDVEYHGIQCKEKMVSPYSAPIPGNIKVGKAVRIRGTTKQTGTGFAVNFSTDPNHHSIALHFNPRPSSQAVVRNSNLGGWGGEETDFNYPGYPFSDGDYFDLMFVCTDEMFHMYVNDNELAGFCHRTNYKDISHLQVVGDIDIADVEIFKPEDENFVKQIPSGLEPKDVLLFKGFVKPNADGFAINLLNGPKTSSDIALHLNPRIGQGQVVFNSKIRGGWAGEEREGIPPVIAAKRPFDIKIVTEKKNFKVFVNGKFFKDFKSRSEIGKIQAFNVAGGVYMYQAKLERAMDKPVLEYIPCGIRAGSWIVIQGMPEKKSNGFAINLKCGDEPGSDIALHYNPRFGSCTVRNSLESGSWRAEERDEKIFPFKESDSFEIVIKVLQSMFKVH